MLSWLITEHIFLFFGKFLKYFITYIIHACGLRLILSHAHNIPTSDNQFGKITNSPSFTRSSSPWFPPPPTVCWRRFRPTVRRRPLRRFRKTLCRPGYRKIPSSLSTVSPFSGNSRLQSPLGSRHPIVGRRRHLLCSHTGHRRDRTATEDRNRRHRRLSGRIPAAIVLVSATDYPETFSVVRTTDPNPRPALRSHRSRGAYSSSPSLSKSLFPTQFRPPFPPTHWHPPTDWFQPPPSAIPPLLESSPVTASVENDRAWLFGAGLARTVRPD